MSDSNQHINPLTGGTTTTTGHPYDRDEFLREVVEDLRKGNERWPGLWTRLESLLNERDNLVEQFETEQRYRRENYDGMVFWKTRFELLRSTAQDLYDHHDALAAGGIRMQRLGRVLEEASSPASVPPCAKRKYLTVALPGGGDEARVYECELPNGHDGAHICGELMWPREPQSPAIERHDVQNIEAKTVGNAAWASKDVYPTTEPRE